MVKLPRAWLSLFAFVSVFLPRPSVAQITPAVGSTGTTVTVNGQQFDIGGGAFSRDGQNLFHLFQQFGLNEGQIANFLSNPGVRNVLAGVNGGDVSYINGLIQLTGGTSNLYLLNPAGIVFGPNASLNVPAAFHASTAQRVHFDGGVFDINGVNDYTNLVGNPTAFEFLSTGIIINEGNLAVRAGQSLSLMGHQVINTGTLSAPGGMITIQAVPETGMVRISQEGMLLSLEFPADRIPEDGVIEAVDIPRLITGGEDRPRVNSVVENPDGSVSLVHDPSKVNVPVEGATTVASGILDVSNPEGVGGQINVLGQNVALINAQLNASGGGGGGTILVGGDYLGGTADTGRLDSSLNAQNLFVDSNTVLNADAVAQGQGGMVINWADNSTQFNGSVSARGGLLGGDGGFIEISGRETLSIAPGWSNRIDVSAPTGQSGTLLFDPSTIRILASSEGEGPGEMVTNPFNPGGPISELLDSDIAFFLDDTINGGNLLITTEAGILGLGLITINANANITWSEATTLTLTADRSIVMNPGAVIRNTSATTGFDAIVFNANNIAGIVTGNFTGIELNGATLSSAGGNIRLTGRGGNSGSDNYGINLNGASTSISSTDGAIALTGTGGGTGTSNYGIYQQNAAQVSSTSGNITYTGMGGDGTDSNFGIWLTGINTTISSGDGAIAMTGTGRGDGTSNYGIYQLSAAQVSTTGTGNITYTGMGGNGTNSNFGIFLFGTNTSISSQGGAIALTGEGGGNGTALSNNNYGIYQFTAQVSTTGTGNITYTGMGGNGTNNNYGIFLFGANTSISSQDGAIALTGTGRGNGNSNRGISQQSSAQVSTTSGNITYTGEGGEGGTGSLENFGIFLSGAGSNITSTSGVINLTGTSAATTGNSHSGIRLVNGQVSSGGNILLTGTGGNGGFFNDGVVLLDNALIQGSGTASITLTGTGGVGTGNLNRGIVQQNGADVTTANGNIIYSGEGGSGVNTNLGIDLSGASTTITSGAGDINLTGIGGGTGGFNYGILQQLDSQVFTGTGDISYVGTGAGTADGIRTQDGSNLIGNSTSGNITLTALTNGITLNDVTLDTTANIQINAPGNVTQSNSSLLASGLELLGAGNFTLDSATNNITTLAGNTTGAISFTDANSFTVGTVNTVGLSTGNTIALQAISGNITLASNTPLSSTAGPITLQAGESILGNAGSSITTQNQAITLNSDLDETNGGAIRLTGTTINSNGGNITLGGGTDPSNTAAIGTATHKSGIQLDGANLTAEGGNISLIGVGFSSGNNNYGIYQLGAAQVSSASGNIAYTGTGGNGTSDNYGIFLEGTNTAITTTITSVDGAIELTGTGGNGTEASNRGIYQLGAAQVSSASGNITYTGTGGDGTNSNHGIWLFGANTTIISGDGAIELTGTGGGDVTNPGVNNYGIWQQSAAQVSTTGTGSISYTGMGGNGTNDNYGIRLNGIDTTIGSVNGAIALTGTGGGNVTNPGINNYGIWQQGEAKVSTTGTGNITYTGTGGNGTDNNHGIFQQSAAQVSTTGTGNITYAGEGGDGTNNNHGIWLTGANTTITSGGAIALTGTGGGTGTSNRGIFQQSGAKVSTTSGNIIYSGEGGMSGLMGDLENFGIFLFGTGSSITSTSGTISLTGTSAATTGNSHSGIRLVNGQVSSGGNILLTGTGGNGDSFNDGIVLLDNALIQGSGTASITLTGTGGVGTGNLNRGIVQQNGADVTTANGNIIYSGEGGSGVNTNLGIDLSGASTTIMSGAGNINLTGIGGGTGGFNYGILQQLGAQVFTGTGDISYTGTGAGTSDSIHTVTGSNLIGNGTTGNITLTGDRITLGNVSIETTNNLLIQPFTNGQLIDLGGADTATTLGLSQAELDQLTANTLQIGNANTGNINVSSAITLAPAKVPTLSLITGGEISQTAPLGVQRLGVTSQGNVTLTDTNNQIQALGANTSATGDLSIVTATDLTIDTVNPTGIANADTVLLQAGGDIILEQDINAINDITLVATNNFINNAGTNALQSTSGRWLVYATSPGANQPGGLTGSEQFSLTYPGIPSFAGNGFIFSDAAPIAPIVTPSITQPLVVTTITATVTNPVITPPPVPTSTPPTPESGKTPESGNLSPTILTPVDLPLPSGLSTILQGQEEEEMPLDQSLCQFLEEGEEIVLEIDGVPVESALAEECR